MATMKELTKGATLHTLTGKTYTVLSKAPQNLNYFEKEGTDPTHVVMVTDGHHAFDLFVNAESLAKHYQ
jgi:hypothetical protein